MGVFLVFSANSNFPPILNDYMHKNKKHSLQSFGFSSDLHLISSSQGSQPNNGNLEIFRRAFKPNQHWRHYYAVRLSAQAVDRPVLRQQSRKHQARYDYTDAAWRKKTIARNLDRRNIRFHTTNEQCRPATRIQDLQSLNIGNAKVLGRLVDGKLSGYCEVTYVDGSVFKGQFSFGSKVHGTFNFHDGSVYIGSFHNENFNGNGKFIYSNGKIIEGTFLQGQPRSKTKIIYPNGDIYYGQTENYKKHGKGVIYFTNNTKFVGSFYEGKIEGEGRFFEDGQLVQQGYWKRGRLVLSDKT